MTSRGAQTQLTEEQVREMRDFAAQLNPDLGPMFGRDVVRLADAYLAQQRVIEAAREVVAAKSATDNAENDTDYATRLDVWAATTDALRAAVSVGSPETRTDA